MDVGVRGGRGSRKSIPGWVLLAVLIVAGCASKSKAPAGHPGTTAKASPATAVKTFAAYDTSGQLAVQVQDVQRGSCWTTSIAAPDDPHAYRCLAGNSILDPCFAPPSGRVTQVACLAAPWSQAEMLQLTKPLPTMPPADGSRPWAFELATGARCVASTGTVPQVAGVNLDYHCSDGSDAALLDPTARQVSAEYAKAPATVVQRAVVTTIWRG